jgi:hypothetical protein
MAGPLIGMTHQAFLVEQPLYLKACTSFGGGGEGVNKSKMEYPQLRADSSCLC